MDWRPIETAPRDGSWFVIAIPDFAGDGSFYYETGFYQPLKHPRYVEVDGGLFRREFEQIYDWRGFNNFGRAVSWAPVVEPSAPPPSVSEPEGGE